MPTTSRLALPYPTDDDDNDVAGDLLALATKLDTDAAADFQGTLAARPAAGVRGRYYSATDVETLYRDTGSAWKIVGSSNVKTYSPTITMGGSMTGGLQNGDIAARYVIEEHRVTVMVKALMAYAGSASDHVTFSLPVVASSPGTYIGAGAVQNVPGWASTGGTPGQVDLFKFDKSNFSVGSGQSTYDGFTLVYFI